MNGLAEIAAFLAREAALLDENRLEEWLALYTPDAIYWVPSAHGQVSGRDQVSHIYDDRKLMETRVRRMVHAGAHARRPVSRTVHVVGNVRLAEDQPEGAVAVLSNQLVTEYRAGKTRLFAGICRHELAGALIRLKRFELVDAESVHEGISIIL